MIRDQKIYGAAYSELLQNLEEAARNNLPYPYALVQNFLTKWALTDEENPMTEAEYNSIKSAYYGF